MIIKQQQTFIQMIRTTKQKLINQECKFICKIKNKSKSTDQIKFF